VIDGYVTTSAQSADGITWEYAVVQYSWDPATRTFHEEGGDTDTLTSPGDDPVIFAAAGFDCPYTG
jgi:hypothetical protein